MPEGVYDPKKVSTRKGNNKKSAQAHKNAYAFHANKGSKITKKIAAMPVGGLCEKCYEVIMWRKKFKKYKPLTTMKKCVSCEQKAIKDAYHVMCNKCAGEKNVCAKCLESRDIVPTSIKTEKEVIQEQVELERLLSGMTERERRSYLRKLEHKKKGGDDNDIDAKDTEEGDSEDESGSEDDSDEDDDDDDDEESEDEK
ncbi:hypothetical protein BX616_003004 [Lobosporangium transversale]|uniref:Uncharacterized protein n=1 Tax=Lobosporangium transversale TaxID=64571 RepID=A0A1Y2GS60_9FUNG|nr:hypothetical protein BCR41DRAFT_394895 [Lobosporangium transversale]KAF9899517.1 hypothetical protein BX616_003004 [Lobosporangium transversale]ORZ20987.1 hypothetical protein BCR41DRAFT_394895 [Lobosporangium transversale]|eukprot:XP_021882896.1 hypothetical protein BCR41DRAFT_394895 [Lobosporangium transversale]